jgi:BMFP domain-containing protein YqiC
MNKKDPGSQEFKTEQKALETRIKRLESQVMRPIKKKKDRAGVTTAYYCISTEQKALETRIKRLESQMNKKKITCFTTQRTCFTSTSRPA